MSSVVSAGTPSPTIGTIGRKAGIGTVIAVVINAVLYLVGATFTFPPETVSPIGEPVTLGSVIIFTIFAGVMAAVGYFILSRFISGSTLRNVTIAIAVVIELVMLGSPFVLSNVDTAQIVIMEIMHVVAALPVYFILRR